MVSESRWRAWRRPADIGTGLGVLMVTVAGGMMLRRLVWDDSTAVSFVAVATVLLGGCLVGWRVVAGVYGRRNATTAQSGGSASRG